MLATVCSCGAKEDPVDAGQRLCGGEAGIGMRVTGRAAPVEFCVDAADVAAIFTRTSRYDVRASLTVDDVLYEIQMIFTHRDDWPVQLSVTGDPAVATSDPGAAWIFYQEIPSQGDAIESTTVSGGTFTLAFSAGDVVTGTFSNLRLEMRDTAGGQAAGSRTVDQGFFSIAATPE